MRCPEGSWHEASFIPDVADRDPAWRVASRFRQLRGDDYAGGFVLRRFESFVGAEVRTWWVEGSCRLVTAHPDTPAHQPAAAFDLAAVEASVRALDLPFVTADFALRDDGRWRIVEIGDGQVSDRPRSTPAAELIAALNTEDR
ncbi:ATP-grasp domain-containing protein [Micromonospora sp. MS34]|uniref:ATP-grasp domain-containing protein n=1 Tax=Micromonospora sp. MS34 TaxID=3385971 RepID=UPI0039A2E27E